MLKSYLSKFLAIAVLMTTSFCLVAQTNATLTVGDGDAIGNYAAIQAGFGPAVGDDITAPLSFPTDTSGATTACVMIDMDLTGTIALVDRGACAFVTKATEAEAAGAMALIICNSNTDQPTQAIVAGGDDMGTLTIPSVMVAYNLCQTIRMGGAGAMATLSATTNLVAGDICDQAIEITPGDYVLDTINYNYSTVFADAGNAVWYSYTPTTSTAATVTSCGEAADSRVTIITGTDCTLGDAVVVAQNDDCDFDNDVYSSEVSFAAVAGVRYWILWDDRWSMSGFNFTLSEAELPMVDVEVTVDMRDQEVAAEGVFLAGSHNEWMDGAMTDNGDGTWTGVITATSLDTVQYKFKNGPDVWESGDLSACGVDDGFGGSNRAFVVSGLTGGAFSTVCFNSCEACPPLETCPSLINDNFDAYDLGAISAQAAHWTTWSPGSAAEDAVVSDAFAASGSNAMEISTADPDDMILLLGNRTEGNYILKWNMYVPTGNGAYYNLQKDEVPNTEFGVEVAFNVDGTGLYQLGDGFPFTYPHDTWFTVYHAYDVDNNLATVYYDGQLIAQHPIAAEGELNQLGSIDFYGFPTLSANYFVDDVLFKQIEACPANALICDGADGYDTGALSAQAPHWTPWSLDNNGADDAVVVNSQFLSCEQSILVSEANGTDLLLQLGDRTEGNYSLSWSFYIPTGQTGYFNTQKFEADPGAEFGTQVVLAADGTGSLDAGAAAAATFTFPHDEWFNVTYTFDLDNDAATLSVAGAEVFAFPASTGTFDPVGTLQLGGVNFYGNEGTEQYIDNVMFVQLPSRAGDVCAGSNDINGLLGQGLNNVQTSSIYDNTGYSANGPEMGWECFGEPDGLAGSPSLENTIWFTFVGDGETYFMTTINCDGVTDYITDGDTQMALYSGDCGTLTAVDCNEDDPNGPDGEFPAALEVATEEGVTYYMMIDGFDAAAFGGGPSIGQFCLSVDQLTAAATSAVTFSVDMQLETVSAEGVFLAGSFNGWPNPGMPLTDNGDGTWSVTLDLEQNMTYEYKFQNGTDGWEMNPPADCNMNNNRFVEVATDDVTIETICFNACVDCATVLDVIDPEFAAAIAVFPNPASDQTTVRYNFESSVDLTINVVNTLGQVVKSNVVANAIEGTYTLDVSGLAAGMYMLHLTDGERVATQSLVVE